MGERRGEERRKERRKERRGEDKRGERRGDQGPFLLLNTTCGGQLPPLNTHAGLPVTVIWPALLDYRGHPICIH